MINAQKVALVVVLEFVILSILLTSDVYAQSRDAKTILDQLLSTDKNRGLRNLPRAKLARSIALDKTLSPKIRVNVLTAVLREEIENPCPMPGYIHGGHITPTDKLKWDYVRALAAIGTEAIPHLRPHLAQLKLSAKEAAGDSEYQKWLRMEEIYHIRFTLGLLGDMDVFPDVLALLEDDSADGYVRETAVIVLGKLKNEAAIPALTRALKDNFHVNFHSHGRPKTSYPVRSAAYSALKELGLRVEPDYRYGEWKWNYQILEPAKLGEIYKFLTASDLIVTGFVVTDTLVVNRLSKKSGPLGEFIASLHTVQVDKVLYVERKIKEAVFFKDDAKRVDLTNSWRKPNRILVVDLHQPGRKWLTTYFTDPSYLFFLKVSDLPTKYPESYLYDHFSDSSKVTTVASLNERFLFEPALDSINSTRHLGDKHEKSWLPYIEVLGEAMSIPDLQRKKRRLVELSNNSDETLASNARNLLAILRERVQE